ncbi:MAG: hypothetical protein ABFD07_14230 [Methanobacterium sp.]
MWCTGSYTDFWEMTPAEIRGKITAIQKKEQYDKAWFSMITFNSQGPKKDDTPWTIEDFLPPEEKTPQDNKQYTKTFCERFKLWADQTK